MAFGQNGIDLPIRKLRRDRDGAAHAIAGRAFVARGRPASVVVLELRWLPLRRCLVNFIVLFAGEADFGTVAFVLVRKQVSDEGLNRLRS